LIRLAGVAFAADGGRVALDPSRRAADRRHASNLPLLLPWAILIFAVLPLLRRKPVATLAVVLLAALVSFCRMAILNAHYCGDWSGAKLEPPFMA